MKIFLTLAILMKYSDSGLEFNRKTLIVRLAILLTKELIRENYGFAYKSKI